MAHRAAVCPRLNAVIAQAVVLAGQNKFSRNSRQQLVLGALLATVLEKARSVASNLENADATAAYILLRSALEAYADLCNLASSPEYLDSMGASFYDQQRKFIRNARRPGSTNPFLRTLSDDPEAECDLERLDAKLAKLREKGIVALSARQRFERAGLLDYYEGPYATLCQKSHNNLSALVSRHLPIGPSGYELVISSPPRDEDYEMIADTTAGIAADSVARVNSFLTGGAPAGLEPLTKALDVLRQLWRQHS